MPEEVVVNLNNPNISITDAVQKAMYRAMENITGDTLGQFLSILGVKTTGIETMADLLNPVKIFPTSFQSLTTPTADGSRAIYVNSSGTVNSNLSTALPSYVLSTVI